MVASSVWEEVRPIMGPLLDYRQWRYKSGGINLAVINLQGVSKLLADSFARVTRALLLLH